jgi:hypothetical protein
VLRTLSELAEPVVLLAIRVLLNYFQVEEPAVLLLLKVLRTFRK